MDFDNIQSVTSVSDTLPYEAISITGRDCFLDGSVPNPLVSVGSPTMSVSSIIPWWTSPSLHRRYGRTR
jgi:hypothetical protein